MSIAEQKAEIIGLLERLRSGSASSPALPERSPPRSAEQPSTQITRRREQLSAARSRRDNLELKLLEERLLKICDALDRRIAKIEGVLSDATVERAPAPGEAAYRGTELASNSSAMDEDLNTAGPSMLDMGLGDDADRGFAAEAPGSNGNDALLSGEIQDDILSDILQMICSNTKTGIFKLGSGDEKVELYLRDGNIYHATTGDMEGQNAFFAAMALTSGKFHFIETEDVPDEVTIEGNTQFLILEALRQIDEGQEGQE